MKKFSSVLIVGLILCLLLTVIGCGGGEPAKNHLRLTAYKSIVINGTPADPALVNSAIKNAVKAVDEPTVRGQLDKMFNLPDEPGNLVGEATKLDALIAEINSNIDSENHSLNPSVTVTPNPDPGGIVTLPFFNEAVSVDYLVELYKDETGGSSKYAGYKFIDSTHQTVVLFHVGPVYTWESQSTRDYTLFYGVKNGDVIDIYSAVIGADPDTGVKIKGWAFKIHIEGQTWFEVRHNSNVYTFSSAGAPDADFILRCRESPIVFSGGDYVVLYNYADGLYDVEDEFAPASYGDPLNESDLTKPAAVSNETWTRIITFGSTIYNPDDIVAPPCPADITSFNNTFLSGAF